MDVSRSWNKDFVIKSSVFPDPDKVDFEEIDAKLKNSFRIGVRYLFDGGIQILYSSSDYICRNSPADCSLYNCKTNQLIITICVNFGAIEILSADEELIFSIPIVE